MNVQNIAQVAHELNKAYCESIGDNSQPSWADAPEWQKSSAVAGVNFHLENPGASPSASHENWMKQKTEEGWKYGPIKDAEKKEHPAFLPYDQLPLEQKSKDYIFRQTIHSLAPYIIQGTSAVAQDEVKQEQASLTTSGLSKPEGVDQKVWDAWISKMPQTPPFAPESGDHSKGSVDENGVKNDDDENIDGPKGHLK